MVSVFESYTALQWGIASSKYRPDRPTVCELGAEAARVTLVHLVQMRSDRSWRMPVEAVMLL